MISIILLITLTVGLSGPAVFGAAAAQHTYSGFLEASSQNRISTFNEQETFFGIDVSYAQGNIDWDQTAKEIDFAIVRCGFGEDIASQDDKRWIQNADACTRLGITWGVYFYSYAKTDEQARSEARHAVRLLEGYNPQLPVFYDLEEKQILEVCSPEDILRHAKIFCEEIAAAGYTPGIYANAYWWINYLTSPEYDQWIRWIARYNSNGPSYGKEYTIWQFSDCGSIAGISGKVDLNYWYGPLPGAELEHTHNFVQTAAYAASCTQDGLLVFACSCGDTYQEVIPALGHDYADGNCIRCGRKDSSIAEARKGDLNGDGTVSSADAVLLARYLSDLVELTEVQFSAADVNEDGTVSSADAVMVARYLVNLQTFDH